MTEDIWFYLAEEENPHDLGLLGEGQTQGEKDPASFLPRGLESKGCAAGSALLQISTEMVADGPLIHNASGSSGAGWEPFTEKDTSLVPWDLLEKDLCLTSRQLSTMTSPGDRCVQLSLFPQYQHRCQP